MLKNSFKSKIFVGKLFKEISLQKYDIYQFIIYFLGSDIKLGIELDLLDLNQETLDKCTNYLINKYNLNHVSNNYNEIILQWIGETIQSWYTDMCLTGEYLQQKIDKKIINYMYDSFYLLSSQSTDYIYEYIFDMTNEEIESLHDSINNLEKDVIDRNRKIDTYKLKNKINNLLDCDSRSVSKELKLMGGITKYRRYPYKINRELLKNISHERYNNDKRIESSQIKSASMPVMEKACRVVKGMNIVINKDYNVKEIFMLEEPDKKVSNNNSRLVVARTKKNSDDIKGCKKVKLDE